MAKNIERGPAAALGPNAAAPQQGPLLLGPTSQGRPNPATLARSKRGGHIVGRSNARQRCLVRIGGGLRGPGPGVSESHQDIAPSHEVDDAGERTYESGIRRPLGSPFACPEFR